MKRAIRRHHCDRLAKARRFWFDGRNGPDAIVRLIDTPTPCSCDGCGNRRWVRMWPTVAECRFLAEPLE